MDNLERLKEATEQLAKELHAMADTMTPTGDPSDTSACAYDVGNAIRYWADCLRVVYPS